jgi:hypothetical protein
MGYPHTHRGVARLRNNAWEAIGGAGLGQGAVVHKLKRRQLGGSGASFWAVGHVASLTTAAGEGANKIECEHGAADCDTSGAVWVWESEAWQRTLNVGSGTVYDVYEDSYMSSTAAAHTRSNPAVYLGGSFTYSNSSNVVVSRDRGASWGDVGAGVAGGSAVQAVRGLAWVVDVEVFMVIPSSVPPRGGAVITVTGRGFKAFEAAERNDLTMQVGATKCADLIVVDDEIVQ